LSRKDRTQGFDSKPSEVENSEPANKFEEIRLALDESSKPTSAKEDEESICTRADKNYEKYMGTSKPLANDEGILRPDSDDEGEAGKKTGQKRNHPQKVPQKLRV
jgi:hypothetical protein